MMKFSILLAALLVPAGTVAFSFNTYDLGLSGLYPRQRFQSADFEPPVPKITRWDSRCYSGNVFLTPRGPLVSGKSRGPIILDAKGNLVWMDNKQFKQAMNLNVQSYKGKDYLTFWTKTKKNKKGGHKKHSKKSFVLVCCPPEYHNTTMF